MIPSIKYNLCLRLQTSVKVSNARLPTSYLNRSSTVLNTRFSLRVQSFLPQSETFLNGRFYLITGVNRVVSINVIVSIEVLLYLIRCVVDEYDFLDELGRRAPHHRRDRP